MPDLPLFSSASAGYDLLEVEAAFFFYYLRERRGTAGRK